MSSIITLYKSKVKLELAVNQVKVNIGSLVEPTIQMLNTKSFCSFDLNHIVIFTFIRLKDAPHRNSISNNLMFSEKNNV